MRANEMIKALMERYGKSYQTLADECGLSSRQAAYKMLNHCDDLKVGTFLMMLDCFGCELKVVNSDTDEEVSFY